MITEKKCPKCGGPAPMSRYCGAYVCLDCDHHVGLVRCYCGWAESGGNGRQELEDLGEVIEEEV